MHKILIYCGLISIIDALPQQSPYYNVPIPKDVEVFASLFPGVKVPDPKPLPPRKPAATTSKPTYPTKEPYSPTFYPKKPPSTTPRKPITTPKPILPTKQPFTPTFYPKKPPSSTKKPFTTKIPPIYPWVSKKPLHFPTPIYPSFGINNTPFTSTHQPPQTTTPSYQPIQTTATPSTYPSSKWPAEPTTATPSTYPSSKWPADPPKPSFNPSPTSSSTPWQPKYPSTASGTTGTPPWIYPPRPSWPRPHHLVSTTSNYVTDGIEVEDKRRFLTGSISEYQPYDEADGSFKLGFQLRNGLSAKVHGYKHNGKLVLEGLFSIFTEDGKPVNIIYKTDENNYRDSEPTIFHLDIPSFDQINLDDENDDLNPVPMYMPFQSNSSKILTIDQSADDDGQFSDLILEPTTQQPDDEDSYTTEISIE